MVWHFRLSTQGVQVVKKARQEKKWKTHTDVDDNPLLLASGILKPDRKWPIETFHGKIYADGINEASWRRFLRGQEISAEVFAAYCHALNVNWEKVIDWSVIEHSIPFVALPRSSFNQDSAQSDFSNRQLKDISEFIRDVTIPDGMLMRPGEEFTKIWEIRNAGDIVWKNRYLMRIGACFGPALISSPRRVKIPTTEPGQHTQISVNLKAPDVVTTTTALWKMTDRNGTLCFPDRYRYGLCVVIQVI
jgi:Ig-like domain from next to BRCA1 gene